MAKQDIRIDLGFLEHPKTIRLRRRLGPEGVLALLRLWVFAARNHQDGILPMDDEGIADACGWDADSMRLVSALCEGLKPDGHGFLERGDDGCFILHDWEEHQPWIFHAPERSEKAKRAARARWEKRNGCGEHADSMRSVKTSNAPSPTPTPIPTPIPDLKEDQVSTPATPVETVDNQKKPRKKHYAEYVMLTEQEYQKLVEAHGEAMVQRMIEILDNYKGAKGKRYKDDYRAILNWVVQRAQEERAKGIAPTPKALRKTYSNRCNCWPPQGMRTEKNSAGQIVAMYCAGCGALLEKYE